MIWIQRCLLKLQKKKYLTQKVQGTNRVYSFTSTLTVVLSFWFSGKPPMVSASFVVNLVSKVWVPGGKLALGSFGANSLFGPSSVLFETYPSEGFDISGDLGRSFNFLCLCYDL